MRASSWRSSRQALAGVLRLPRRFTQPDRGEHHVADVGDEGSRRRDPRDVSVTIRALLQEHLLVRGDGLLEETLVLVPTPQSLIAEGSPSSRRTCCSRAMVGPPSPVSCAAQASSSISPTLAVKRALQPCRWSEVNAALMLHRRRGKRGRGAGISRALGSDHAGARHPRDPLLDRADLTDIRHHPSP